MKKFYMFLLAVLATTAALAQSHPLNTKFLPRLHSADVALPTRHAAPAKAEGQVLPINTADPVKLYTNEEYSQPGHYDYYFSFANTDDEFYFPMVFFDLYLPTDKGLVAGTYTMSEGTVDPNLMLMANYNDYIYYYYGYAAYEWTDATIKLTEAEGEDAWTVDFSASSTEGYTYTFTYTGTFTVELDDFDPNDQGTDEPEVEYTYDYEPANATNMNIVFGTPDCSDAYVDEYLIYDIYLDSEQQDANGRNYEGRLYLITKEHQPHADFYPVNSSEAQNTFLASQGCPADSSNDLPCYIRTYDKSYVYDSWYLVAGHITLAYNAASEVTLEGDVETAHGSKIHFSTANLDPEGLHSVLADNVSGTPAAKMIRDGKVYIQGGRGLYTTAGQRVK